MVPCLIGLGSNLDVPRSRIVAAIERLRAEPEVSVRAVSSIVETKPIGGPSDQAAYANACAWLDVACSPFQLLERLQRIEVEMGRVRDVHWGARTLDLDLLLFGQAVIGSTHLEIPHPRIPFRRFVLEPAVEIAPNWVHPIIGRSLIDLLENINRAPRLVVCVGSERAKATVYRRPFPGHVNVRRLRLRPRDFENSGCSGRGSAGGNSRTRLEFELDALRRIAESFLEFRGTQGNACVLIDTWFDEIVVRALPTLTRDDGMCLTQSAAAIVQSVAEPNAVVILRSNDSPIADADLRLAFLNQGIPTLSVTIDGVAGSAQDQSFDEILALIQGME